VFLALVWLVGGPSRYATQWDAFDKGIMHTQTAPLVIMIGLCVTAIICVICYGVMVPYSDAVWLKVLADDEDALDKPPPESPVPDVEQAWGGANETTDAAGASKPQSAEDDDDDVDTKAALPPRLDWRVHPTILEAGLADIIVKWDAPPGTKPEDIQCVWSGSGGCCAARSGSCCQLSLALWHFFVLLVVASLV